jgi:hypothetical protein
MATETLYPTTVTTPSVGGGSCSGNDTARTCDAISECDGGLQKETADHKSFQSPSYQSYWTSATLYAAWKTDGQSTSDRYCVNFTGRGEFKLRYTLNASTWYDFSGFPRYGYNLTKTGTASLGLSTSQDISKVRVRNNCQAEGGACPTGACCSGVNFCSCSITTEAACGGYYLGDSTSCSGACDFPACGGGDPFPPPV